MSKMKKVKKKMNWWKLIAIVLIVIFAFSLALKGCGNALSKIQSVPANYTDTVKTGGVI